MAPHSPGTDQIDTLLWIGLIAGLILILAINVAMLYALRRYRAARGSVASEPGSARSLQLRAGGALGAFALAMLVIGIVYTEKAHEAPATGPNGLAVEGGGPLKITATGQQWLWRYDYPNDAASYYKLVVPVDTDVELQLVSTDVIHTWDVPALAGKRDAVPGKTNRVRFRADREGTFRGFSATLSGQGYGPMRTEVEVVSPDAYEDFVEGQLDDTLAAQEHVVEQLEGGNAP